MTALHNTGDSAGQEVFFEVQDGVGRITLHRPRALNALNLTMVRLLTHQLTVWRDDPTIRCVAMRGQGRDGPFGVFCAGGDIRFLHGAALAGDLAVGEFFTEEYRLDFLIHRYPKPVIAFMDGVVMGGGMGLAQGATLRIVTERTRMAMPETQIGLFPDVGGGYFLSRCPGSVGEYLALTGATIDADDALAYGLADVQLPSAALPALWQALPALERFDALAIAQWCTTKTIAACPGEIRDRGTFDAYFSLPSVAAIVAALDVASSGAHASDATAPLRQACELLRRRSPLMLHVALEQIRRARSMSLADELRMERGMVERCFTLRPVAESETVEGIRALAIDKDHAPRWNPAQIDGVTPAMVAAFFESPWTADTHPLRTLM